MCAVCFMVYVGRGKLSRKVTAKPTKVIQSKKGYTRKEKHKKGQE